MDYLNRSQAPFPSSVWQAIDEAAAQAARDRLTGRRFLDLEGPFGAGLTTIEVGNDDYCRQPGPDEAGAVMGRSISLPMLRKSFRLSIRRVAAHIENGQPLDLSPAQDAAEAVADREEEFIYRGQPAFGLSGLLTMEGRQQVPVSDWTAPDGALKDVLAAATRLDESGFRGPYALVLAPALYNNLFRLYPGTDVMGLEHLRRLCTAGIYKAAIDGGVLVDTRVGVLILGQDLGAGYSSQDGVHYHLYLSESIVLRIDEPEAICVITAPAGS
jgi:uncharacterized linocin/CFP29 family protein